MNRASHYLEGGRSCGKHISFIVGKEAPAAPAAAVPAFIPFDCGICLDECKSAKAVFVRSFTLITNSKKLAYRKSK